MKRLAAIAALASLPVMADAHPHLFVDAGLTFHVEGGRLTAVTVTWRYDEFSSMLMVEDHGLDPDFDGKIETGAIAGFAGKDVAWDQGFPGDLELALGDEMLALAPPHAFDASYADGRITSTHTRALSEPAPLDAAVTARIFDPGYFVAYDVILPVDVSGAQGCEVARAEADLDAAYTAVEELLYGPRSSEFNEDNYPQVGNLFADTLTLTCAASS